MADPKPCVLGLQYARWDDFELSESEVDEDEYVRPTEWQYNEEQRQIKEDVDNNPMLKRRYPNGTDDDVVFPPTACDAKTKAELMQMQPGGEKVLQAAREFKAKLKADKEAGEDPRTAAERFAAMDRPEDQVQPATWRERIERAAETKAHANSLFSSRSPSTAADALPGYLAAIWLLKKGKTPYPAALSKGQHATRTEPPRGASAVRLVGDGTEFHEDEDEPVIEEVECLSDGDLPAEPVVEEIDIDEANLEWDSDEEAEMEKKEAAAPPKIQQAVGPAAAETARIGLHLNVALAALRLEDFLLCEAACDFVLSRDPTNVKALYRLGQAHDAAGRHKKALRVLARAIKADPKNAEVRETRTKIKDRLDEESWNLGDVQDTHFYRDKKDWEPPPLHEGKVIPPQGLYKRTFYLHPLAKLVLRLTIVTIVTIVTFTYWNEIYPLLVYGRDNFRPTLRLVWAGGLEVLAVASAAVARGWRLLCGGIAAAGRRAAAAAVHAAALVFGHGFSLVKAAASWLSRNARALAASLFARRHPSFQEP